MAPTKIYRKVHHRSLCLPHFQKKYPLDLSKCTVSKSNLNFKRPLRYLGDQGQSCLQSSVLVPSGNRPEIRTITIILVKIPNYYDLTTRRDSHCHERLDSTIMEIGSWLTSKEEIALLAESFSQKYSPSSGVFLNAKLMVIEINSSQNRSITYCTTYWRYCMECGQH